MFHYNSKIIFVSTCLLLSACTSSPEAKVRQAEQRLEKLQETSGYNECMRRIDENEMLLSSCIQKRLTSEGYADGIDCIEHFDTVPCKDTKRYNAEIDASNDCNETVEFATELTALDCWKILSDAQM